MNGCGIILVKEPNFNSAGGGVSSHLLLSNIGTNTHAQIDTFISSKASASGLASLDGSGKVPTSQLPAFVVSNVNVESSELDQLALTVDEGDFCIRTDENKTYIALNSDNVDMSDWQEVLTPTSVSSVDGNTGVVDLTSSYVGIPAVAGTSGQILSSLGSGNTQWVDVEALPTGSADNTVLRWDGSDWVEETSMRLNSAGRIALGSTTSFAGYINISNSSHTESINIYNSYNNVSATGIKITTDYGYAGKFEGWGTNGGLYVASASGKPLIEFREGSTLVSKLLPEGYAIYDGANVITLQRPTLSGDVTFTLPDSNGTSGQYLQTDGSGNTSWETVSGGTSNHTALSNIGTNTHAQIDTHIADDTKHRIINDSGSANTDLWSADKIQTQIDAGTGVTDHTALSNIGTNTHAQIDTHIADTDLHKSDEALQDFIDAFLVWDTRLEKDYDDANDVLHVHSVLTEANYTTGSTIDNSTNQISLTSYSKVHIKRNGSAQNMTSDVFTDIDAGNVYYITIENTGSDNFTLTFQSGETVPSSTIVVVPDATVRLEASLDNSVIHYTAQLLTTVA